MSFEEDYTEMKYLSKAIQLDLAKGKLKWEDEKVQFFIPAVTFFTDWEWLELIAENTLIEEDAEIVKNFIQKAKSLSGVNAQQLDEAVKNKLKNLFED